MVKNHVIGVILDTARYFGPKIAEQALAASFKKIIEGEGSI